MKTRGVRMWWSREVRVGKDPTRYVSGNVQRPAEKRTNVMRCCYSQRFRIQQETNCITLFTPHFSILPSSLSSAVWSFREKEIKYGIFAWNLCCLLHYFYLPKKMRVSGILKLWCSVIEWLPCLWVVWIYFKGKAQIIVCGYRVVEASYTFIFHPRIIEKMYWCKCWFFHWSVSKHSSLGHKLVIFGTNTFTAAVSFLHIIVSWSVLPLLFPSIQYPTHFLIMSLIFPYFYCNL